MGLRIGADRSRVERIDVGNFELAHVGSNTAQLRTMPRQVHYNAADHTSAGTPGYRPRLRPASSLRQRIARIAWNICWVIFYRLSPRPLHGWRTMLLRLFGAKMGPHCHFYASSRVWAPWNLICADQVTAADGVEIYNPRPYVSDRTRFYRRIPTSAAATQTSRSRFPLLAHEMEVGA